MKKLSADCCQNLLSSSLLSKSINVQMYGTIILSLVLYGCDTWSPTMSEEHRLRVFGNRVLRKIFGPTGYKVTGEWGRWHNETLYDLYSSYIFVIKSRIMMGRGCIARGRGEVLTVSWWGDLREGDHLEDPGWDIKMDLQEVVWGALTGLIWLMIGTGWRF